MRLENPRTVWRLVAARHAKTAFDGEGAGLYGGRWNHPGTPLVYTSATLSLAALELLVHVDQGEAPEDLVKIPAELPAGLDVEVLRPADLPAGWRRFPAPEAVKELGTAWVRSERSVALEVPSAVISEESNLLLSPRHPAMARIALGKPRAFSFDPRLWER